MTLQVVLVPGLGLDDRSSTALRVLLDRVSVQPLPGFGRPAPRSADLSPAALARRLVECLPGPPVVLLGHSASCQIVAEAAGQAPSRVAALVLVGPTTDPRAATWPPMVGRWLATARHEPPKLGAPLVRQYRRTGLGSMARAMSAARRHDIRTPLRGLPAPLTVVRGDRDRIAPADWARALALLTDGAVVTVPGGGHMVPMTHPAEVAEAVRTVSRSST